MLIDNSDNHAEFKDFMCVHGEDGLKKCEDTLKEVYERLSEGSEELLPVEVTDANFLNSVIYSLEIDYIASIDGIYADQWAAISASSSKYLENGLKVYIQCDILEHGLAAVWKAFADHHKDNPPKFKGEN